MNIPGHITIVVVEALEFGAQNFITIILLEQQYVKIKKKKLIHWDF